MRSPALLLFTFALLAACQESVELGSECPPLERCGRIDEAALDSGLDPEQPEPDSAVIAPPDGATTPSFSNAEFPLIENGSFDVPAGQEGDLAMFPISFQASAGARSWRACQPISLRIEQPTPFPTNFTALTVRKSLQTDDGRVIMPVEGDTFLTVSFPPLFPAAISAVPMSQELASPLRSGVAYAFAVSVQGVDTTRRYSLRVYGSNSPCDVEEAPLAEVEVPPEPGWHDVCVTFTPSHDSTHILLTAGILEGFGVSLEENIGFLLDDIRTPEGCDAR